MSDLGPSRTESGPHHTPPPAPRPDLPVTAGALEAARAHTAFVAGLGHDLRSPLNAIIGYSELLQEEAADRGLDDFQADLEKIHAAGHRLLALINDLMDLLKIEAGTLVVTPETVALAPLVEEVAATARTRAAEKGLVLDAVGELGSVRADPARLRQLLGHLVGHACACVAHGTVSLRVTREPAGSRDRVTFRIGDGGPGIAAERFQQLFEAFAQPTPTAGRKASGERLALALCVRLGRLMGGKLSVENDPGGSGFAFTFRLLAEPSGPRSAMAAAAPSGPAESAKLGTLLVIDDEPASRDLMQRQLGKEGFEVVTAGSGPEGIELARRLRPTAITLDVTMPGMDGWAVLAALKADPELADIPVVMVTAESDKDTIAPPGAADCLPKPLDRDRLLAVLQKAPPVAPTAPVLVVEDDAAMRALVRRIVEAAGCPVIEAENGRVALERLAQVRPRLVLLDLEMPEMDGFAFVDAVRQHARWRGIPIVVLTARELTPRDRLRLGGCVQQTLSKGNTHGEDLAAQLRRLVAGPLRIEIKPS